MKAWIKTEDTEEFRRLAQSLDMAAALWETDNLFRKYLNMYENGNISDEVYEFFEKMHGEFIDIKFENGINLDELYK